MCGRYYIDDDTAREIEKIIRQVDEKLRKKAAVEQVKITAKDIHPADMAPVLAAVDGGIGCRWQRWGFPSGQAEGQKKQLVFNARSEAALDKPFFRDSVLQRRAVIPATWFYEWNRNKEKNIFYRENQPVIYLAGFYKKWAEDGEHFVILTTGANVSMQPVHDRMPLVLNRDEVEAWLLDGSRTEELLKKTPPLLERRTDYEQMTLF